MTTVAKIFAFIVAVAAIAFAAASFVMVNNTKNYKDLLVKEQAAHQKDLTAWEAKEADLNQQVTQAKEAQKFAEDQQKEKQAELADLQVAYRTLDEQRKAAEKRNQELTTAVEEIKDRLTKQAGDIETLRKEKEDYRLKSEEATRAQEKAEDLLTSCQEDLAIERQKNAQLTKDLGVARGTVNRFVEEAPKFVVNMDQPEMPDIQGKILKVDNEKGIVLISVGSDDQVGERFSFEVFRPGQYVGRVWVMEVFEERAICRIDATMTKTPIMESDHVSTRLP